MAERILILPDAYVEGSSAVYLAGIISQRDPATGHLTIGGTVVHIGAAGVDPAVYDLSAGTYIEVAGIKLGQAIIAEDITAADKPE